MWKNVGIGTIVSLVLGLFVVGPDRLWTTINAWRHRAKDGWETNKSDVQVAAEIRVGLKDLEDRILKFGDKLGEIEGRAGAAGRKVDEIEAELRKQHDLLARAKTMLDGKETTFTIGGRTYSRDEVNADALGRLDQCKRLEQQLAFERQVAESLGEAVGQARSNLDKAVQVRRAKKEQLTALEARLENARLLGQVEELTTQLRTDPLGPQSELACQYEEFERRVDNAERRLRLSGSMGKSGGAVEWEAATAPDARAAIAGYLKPGEKK